MSGLGIEDLGMPERPYRVDLVGDPESSGFETVQACEKEDQLRARRISRTVAGHLDLVQTLMDELDVETALSVAAKLEAPSKGRKPRPTLASRTFMRKRRIKVAGHVWKLIDEVGAEKVSSFTIIPRTWELTAEECGSACKKDPVSGVIGV